jgi:hypothetical protein
MVVIKLPLHFIKICLFLNPTAQYRALYHAVYDFLEPRLGEEMYILVEQ